MADTGQRTTATILITDLVGSTSLRGRVGEDRAEDLRREHDSVVGSAIERAGGIVVKGTGDGVLARFDSAADAVTAAVGIQNDVVRATRRHPREVFELRVGLSSGDVTVENGDCYGTPVIEAARLCEAAEGGQVLASSLVQMLARGRGGHRFEAVGALPLKGLDEPVDTVVVRWSAPSPAAQIPLPVELATGGRYAFAGRNDPLASLRTAWKQALERRRMVIVSGEPGVGKSRLVAEFTRQAAQDGSVVLFGRSDEHVAVAYEPVRTMLRHLVEHAPGDVIEGHVAGFGPVLSGLVPGIGPPPDVSMPATTRRGGADDADERQLVFDAIEDLLSSMSTDQPTVLVFDDLHWADRTTLLLVRHLLNHVREGLLVIATYRDTDIVRTHPLAELLADLRRDDGVERLALRGLSTDEVTELMETAAGHDLDSGGIELAAAIHVETDGNAFFVGEVLTHLVESGAIVHHDDRWQAGEALQEIGVPQGIREVIGRRLAQLGSDGDLVLRAAAVVGRTFDAAVVASVVDRSTDGVLAVLDDAAARGLVVENQRILDRYEFVHALVQQALVEEVSVSRRVRLHHRIVTAMLEAGRDDDVFALAHHACQAAPHAGAPLAVGLARRAAEAAESAAAFEEACRWYERALEVDELCPDDPRRRSELLFALAHVRITSDSDYPRVQAFLAEAFELALAAADIDLAARIAHELAWSTIAGPGAERLAADVIARLETLIEADDVPSGWLLLAKNLLESNVPEPGELRERGVRALVIADEHGDDALRGAALSSCAQAERGAATTERFDDVTRRLHDLPDFLGSMGGWFARANALVVMGRLEEIEQVVRVLMTTRQAPHAEFLTNLTAAAVATARGSLERARSHERAAEQIADEVGWPPVSRVQFWACRNIRLTWESDWDAIERNDKTLPEHLGIGFFTPHRATRLVALGRTTDAEAAVERWATDALPHVPHWLRPSALVAASRVAQVGGLSTERARHLLPLAAHYDQRWIGDQVNHLGHGQLSASRFAYNAGLVDEAIARTRLALDAHDDAGEVSCRAHGARQLARWLLERDGPGDRDHGRRAAEEALATAERVGMPGLAEDAGALLDGNL